MKDFKSNKENCPILSEKDYQSGRLLFLIEGCSGMAIYTLSSGAFLAGFFNYLGVSDRINGILAAFPILFGIIQLFGPLILEKLEHRKRFTIIFGVSYRAALVLMFIIPLLTKGWVGNSALAATIYGLSALLGPFFSLAVFNWIISLAPDRLRGRYLGLKDALSYIFLTLVTLVMGRVLDFYKVQGQPDRGFLICGITVLMLLLINAGAVWLAKEPKVPVSGRGINPLEVVSITFRDTGFRKIIFFYILWNFGFQFAWPFINVYLVAGLKLDYTYIMVMGLITNAMRVFTNPFWGGLADRKSWELTAKLSLLLLAISHGLLFFVNRDTVSFLFPVYSVLNGIAWGGAGIATFSLQFNYIPEEVRTVYLATNTAIGGIAGFTGTIISSLILGLIGPGIFKLFGFSLGSMQVIFFISAILLTFSALFIHLRLGSSRVNDN